MIEPRPRRQKPLIVRGMQGFGDCIMQRPIIRAAASRGPVQLMTPWPELYQDLEGVDLVRWGSKLRTQARHERETSFRWAGRRGNPTVTLGYSTKLLEGGRSIIEAMESKLPIGDAPFIWDLPVAGRIPKLITGGRPIAVVRPVTERAEWHNASRSPLPEYIAQIAARLGRTHFVVVVADLEPGKEWLVGEMPIADVAFMYGQIRPMDLLELVRAADVVVGGVGWIVPAALALQTRAFIVLGGNGGHNGIPQLIDRRADASRMGFAVPTAFCECVDKHHPCDKRIDRPVEIFEDWAEQMGVRL